MVNIPEWVYEFHGHKCPANPLGYRAGLAALNKLGVERASNKELFLVCENGPAHAMGCFLDGVMSATGCTYGKSNAVAKNYSKTAIVLVDVNNHRAVRVLLKSEFQKKALSSEFVELRKQGIEPKDISADVATPLINKVLNMDDRDLFEISDIFSSDIQGPKGTYTWYECDRCHEIIFENAARVLDGKNVCIPCFESR